MDDLFDTSPDNPFAYLHGLRRNVYSQFGEDGIIAGIFEKVGTTNRWCFEVGANDGIWLSNTKVLRDAGWSAVLIESDAGAYANLLPHRGESIHCVHRHVGPPPNSIDEILAECGVPREMDFGVIDIDGQDYWAWKDMVEYSPRVMCVECHPHDAGQIAHRGEIGTQAGVHVICQLGEEKGYIPIGRTFCNVFFVREDVYDGSSGSSAIESGSGNDQT